MVKKKTVLFCSMKTTQKWGKMLLLGMLGMVLILGLVLSSCKNENLSTESDPEPPPYNSVKWQGVWNGTNLGTINASGTITFTQTGLTESWIAKDGPRSYTIKFHTIIPIWNYRSNTKTEYPSGYTFKGTVISTVNSHYIGTEMWLEFYPNEDNTAFMYDNSDTYAIFIKQK